ncbi:MAG TPA: hypothetical protein VGL55_14075 [Steroidobacteraceae bacterium]|jgi:hypothetical protein
MSTGVPQFTTAEYAGQPGGTACKCCGRAISGAYYRVNDVLTCTSCALRLKGQMLKDSHASFGRGVLFGVGGAIVGFAIYVVFALITGLVAGIVSLAVGYLVGKAVVKGSRGIGGRRYQVAAVLLTYMAVSLSAVPIAVSPYMKQRSAQQHAQVTDAATVEAPKPKMRPARALGMLTVLGLTSPFLALSNPPQAIIGLIILFVGLRIAWRITAGKPVKMVGPIGEPATPG